MPDQLKSTPLDKATAVALRLVTKAGGLPVLQDPANRKRVEKILFVSTRQGLRTESVARKTFARINTNGSKPARAKVAKPRQVFDLTPTEDQQMIQEAAGELAATVLRPAAQEADTKREVSQKVREQAGELGLTLLGVPDELGGIAEERSAVTGVLVTESLAKGDIGLAAALLAPSAVASALALYGDAGQQATFLPAFTEDEPAHGALAIQEPQPLFDPLAPKTKATKVGTDLKIDGVKALVADPENAALFIISALVEGEPRLVIVEAGTPGLSIEDDPAMGVRAARTGRLILEGVTVPAANVLGSTEDHLDAVRRARLAWAAAAVGGAQAALDQLIPYVKNREAFGEPIAHRQAVAFTIADISIELEGLRLVVLKAAARLDSGKDASQQIAYARQLAATYASQIGSHAVQLLGGHGYVKEYPNERWYRDLRGVGVLEGTLLV